MTHHGQRFSLHDYFFAKSVDALQPGGVLALVTSHYTLDKQNASIREYLAEQADFLGAIRLPSDAFKREGTAVVTDIVFLRKRAPGEPAAPRRSRLARRRAAGHRRRRRPDQPLFPAAIPKWCWATWSRKDTLYGEGYSVVGNGDLAEQLPGGDPAVAGIRPVASIRAQARGPRPAFTPPPPLKHIAEGSFFVADDRTICQIVAGQAVPVVYGGTPSKPTAR